MGDSGGYKAGGLITTGLGAFFLYIGLTEGGGNLEGIEGASVLIGLLFLGIGIYLFGKASGPD